MAINLPVNEEKILELIEDISGLKVGMASIDDKLDGLVYTLLGNGQPGVIAEL